MASWLTYAGQVAHWGADYSAFFPITEIAASYNTYRNLFLPR